MLQGCMNPRNTCELARNRHRRLKKGHLVPTTYDTGYQIPAREDTKASPALISNRQLLQYSTNQ
jgi:hypothetical protein